MNRTKSALKSLIVLPAAIMVVASISCDSCEDTHKKHRQVITDPQLGYSVPDKGTHQVSTSRITDVIFYFNRSMYSATITNDTFTLKKDGGSFLPGTVTFNGTDNSAAFTPDSIFSPGTYTATLSGSIEYKNGEKLETDYAWSFTTTPRYWTIMVYLDGDNNLEDFMMDDIKEMMSGYTDLQGYDLIILVDRIDGFSSDESTLGYDFTDTRLYRITNNFYTRLNGGSLFPDISRSSTYEADMGDANTLEKFVSFCKTNYRADNYALILWNHGDGARGGDFTINASLPNKAICQDDTNGGDKLYMAEITDVLSQDDSVDLLGFDACLMGSAEIAYQYKPSSVRFGSDYMAASPPNEWSAGWKYDEILSRIKAGGGTNDEIDYIVGTNIDKEIIYDPELMTARELCGVIVEEQYESTGESTDDQGLSCYDLSQSAALKSAVDTLAVNLALYQTDFENIRGSGSSPATMYYFDASNEREWIYTPYFDLYDLCERIKDNTSLPAEITKTGGYADNVLTAVDNLVVYSFAGTIFDFNAFNGSFTNGKNGIHIFCPDGDRSYNSPADGVHPHWYFQWWYNAIDIDESKNDGYGKLEWCADGATAGNNNVENWFELLDSWFDTEDSSGGMNKYIY